MNIRISTAQFNTQAKRQQFQMALLNGLEKWFGRGAIQFTFVSGGPSATFQGVRDEEEILKKALTPQLKNQLASRFRPLRLSYVF